MPITPSFSVYQNSGMPSVINLTDTSTGSDTSITKRRVYLLQANGEYLVPSGVTTNYVEWDITDVNTRAPLNKQINVLEKDAALTIKVEWLTSLNVVVESKTTSFSFTAYSETFYYGLTQSQIANPSLVSAANWYENKMILRVEIDSANQAITFASDIFSAQAALDRASYIIENSNYFF